MQERLSSRQYVKYCMDNGMAEDVYNTQYPHPYLILWLECRKRMAHTGYMEYPEPEKGYLHQDADLMLGFEVLDEAQDVRAEEEKMSQSVREKAAQMWGN